MNKKTIAAILAIISIIVAALLYAAFSQRPSTSFESESQNSTPPSDQVQPPSANPGSYIAHSAELIASTKGTRILFFHAPWCPQCRELDASIQKEGVPADTTIFKVDYDSNQALRQKYGVTIQTTLVKIDDAGNKIKSYVSYDEPNFTAVKRELLP